MKKLIIGIIAALMLPTLVFAENAETVTADSSAVITSTDAPLPENTEPLLTESTPDVIETEQPELTLIPDSTPIPTTEPDSTLISTAEPDSTLISTTEPESTAAPVPNYVIIAVQSPLLYANGELKNIWDRPYVYNETTYIPLRAVAENLGAAVDYDDETGTISVAYKGNGYGINVNSDKINVFYGVSFVPLRELCNYLGITIKWYNGIITLSDDGYILSTDEVNSYTDLLQYSGYTDEFFLPRTIVNPRVTYTYDQMIKDIEILGKMYPDLIRDIHSIGTSTEGRDIPAFYLGKGDTTIVICASMHAREYIATNVLMYLVDTYALGYVNNSISDGYSIRDTLDNVSFLIVPMVNPDGINLVQHGFDSTKNPDFVKSLPTNGYGARGWKATVNGVDLNNNFDLFWYKKGSGPSYAGYSGDYPASEPETQAMQNLINNTEFPIFVSLHTQGQVIYWMDSICDQSLVEKHSDAVSRMCKELGFDKMGASGNVGYSGYMTDYVRYYKKSMALTIELCPYIGDYPYPESDFDTAAYPVRNLGPILAKVCKEIG